ncbi:MAG: hypothetical protein ACLPXM_19360 [Terriglobales bacterium]
MPKAGRGLHLVTAEEAAELGLQQASASFQKDMDRVIGSGIRRYQQLQAEADRVLFTDPPDLGKLAELSVELHQLPRRLANYGVRV